MSKCQARKYLAGGRCGGSSVCASVQKEDTQQVSASFQQLLAQREAMDAKMWLPPSVAVESKPQQALVVIQETQQVSKIKQKEMDISCILGNDFE